MEEMLEIVQGQMYVEFRARVNDYNALIVDEIGVCHGKTVGDRMYLARLLGNPKGGVQCFPPAVAEQFQPYGITEVKRSETYISFLVRICYNIYVVWDG